MDILEWEIEQKERRPFRREGGAAARSLEAFSPRCFQKTYLEEVREGRGGMQIKGHVPDEGAGLQVVELELETDERVELGSSSLV